MKLTIVVFLLFTLQACIFTRLLRAEEFVPEDDLMAAYEQPDIHISDPLEPLNRVFFKFNDKIYFYVLKPVSKTWAFIVPEEFRASLLSAFRNLLMPVRLVNDLLQGRFSDSGIEISRFVINTTVGVGGLGDPAKYVFKLESSDEDLGQTLGTYGAGEGIYICWPFLGPSNVRDSIGMVGDAFLDPLTYLVSSEWQTIAAVHAGKKVNYTSLNIGEYEQFKEASFDPYASMREFYTKNRRKKIINQITHRQDSQNVKDEVSDIKKTVPLKQSETLTVQRTGRQGNIQAKRCLSDKTIAEKRYYVQVGVFFDRDSMSDLHNKLAALGKATVVVKYRRGDYDFYGLQVPAGQSFDSAKTEEQKLMREGFSETMVVTHATL